MPLILILFYMMISRSQGPDAANAWLITTVAATILVIAVLCAVIIPIIIFA